MTRWKQGRWPLGRWPLGRWPLGRGPLARALRLALLSVVLGACSLAPHYQRPAAPVAAQYPQPADAPEAHTQAAAAAADIGWRQFFTEPELRQLIAAALVHNRDLRTAALRIEEARAQYRIVRGDRLPNLNASIGATRGRTPGYRSSNGQPVVGNSYDAGLSIPAFELDFFGRVRNLSAAALQLYLASDEARLAAQISLVAEVAKAYYSQRAYAEQYRIAEQTLAGRGQTSALTRQRVEVGASSRLELRLDQSLYDSARVAALDLARQREQAGNALTLLVGQPAPAAVAPPPRGAATPAQPDAVLAATDAAMTPLPDDARLDAMSALPAGLPSELLARRPDIRAAELRLLAANANIGGLLPQRQPHGRAGHQQPSLRRPVRARLGQLVVHAQAAATDLRRRSQPRQPRLGHGTQQPGRGRL